MSGLAQDKKDELHQLILSLGARYTRELNLDKNTHLITEAAQGAKYDLAKSSDPKMIHIVTPSWLYSSAESKERACEMAHRLGSTIINPGQVQMKAKSSSKPSLISLLDSALIEVGVSGSRLLQWFLFEKLHFYLIGFEGNPELKQKISGLIRRGGGTIHWDINEDISILLLCDTCDDAVIKAANVVTSHHPNFPPSVSPLWVIESYRRSKLQMPSAYAPVHSPQPKCNNSDDRTKWSKKAPEALSRASSVASTTSNLSIFRGCLFSFVRTSSRIELEQSESNPAANSVVEYDSKELEDSIRAQGGQILSIKLLDALRSDAENSGGFTKRKCYVVCWGGCPPRLDTNPLVSQLQRHELCELVLVTPIWVRASVSARKRIRPERMPLVLIPQSWSMKFALNVKLSLERERVQKKRIGKMEAPTAKSGGYRRLDISLTGFQGVEKEVIIHLIRAIGGMYHNNTSSANTHLVFKKSATGLKLKKAIEWGLHVVSVQWLYHILEHGYTGMHNDQCGCEKRFSQADESK